MLYRPRITSSIYVSLMSVYFRDKHYLDTRELKHVPNILESPDAMIATIPYY